MLRGLVNWNSTLILSGAFSQVLCLLHPVRYDRRPVWVSARLAHPLKPRLMVQMCWQEDRKPGVRGGRCLLPSASTVARGASGAYGGASGASPRRGSRGWGSSSDEYEHYSGRRFNTPWVSSSSQPPPLPDERIPTTRNVQLLRGIQSPPASGQVFAR